VIYKLLDGESNLGYKPVNRIIKQFECNLLVVCVEHIILCQVCAACLQTSWICKKNKNNVRCENFV